MLMWVLGINSPPAGWHDSAACLVDEAGAVAAFSEEERFSGRRHSLFHGPSKATGFCLEMAGIGYGEVDVVAVGWDMPALFGGRAFNEREFLRAALGWPEREPSPELVFVAHHLAHARCAFHSSPFEDAAVLVIDGSGEQEATSIWRLRSGAEASLERSWPLAASLGHAYTGASRWLGFSPLEAGKTMGLAAYGRARRGAAQALVELTDEDYLLDVSPPASVGGQTPWQALGRESRSVGRRWRERFEQISGAGGSRTAAVALHTDPCAVAVAYTAQLTIETSVTWLAAKARELTGTSSLCLAGGVALNCSANGLISQPVYVPPVPHDAGVALGAAWEVCPPGRPGGPLLPYLGAPLGQGPTEAELRARGLSARPLDYGRVASLLARGEVGALAAGRAEIGPRALCHRSIVALPRPEAVSTRANAIKHREPWRPFGPVAFADACDGLWEELGHLSRYMVGATSMRADGRVVAPATVHVDGTTRPQTVDRHERSAIGGILEALERRGVPPVLLNTSFNDRGQPIVNDEIQALDAFAAMGLQFLVLEDRLVVRR